MDTLGRAMGVLTTTPNVAVNIQDVKSFPEPASIMMGSMKMEMHSNSLPTLSSSARPGMNRHNTPLSNMKNLIIGSPYQKMMAAVKTNNPNKPIEKTLHMDLTGYMNRYIWFINGVTMNNAKPILLKPSKRYRIIFTNHSMMDHPMHIHAKQAAQNSVKPLTYANQAIVRVQHLPIDQSIVDHPADQVPRFFSANLLDINQNLINNDQEITYKGLFSGDNNKLQLYLENAEMRQGIIQNANLDMFYWHAMSQFWAIKGGVNYVYHPARTPYFQPGLGIEGLAPYFIQTDIRVYYHNGNSKLDLDFSRDTQIAHNFFIRTEIEGVFASKTVARDLVGSGFNELQLTLRPYYQINPTLAVYVQYQHTGNYGNTQRLFQENDLSTNDNTYSVGLSFLF